MYLDKDQFEPHMYKYADRNFKFYLNDVDADRSQTVWSSYVVCEVIHPHGYQYIPRSILFGIDKEEYDKGASELKRLVKSYWAQYEIKYRSYLEETELFIIYGMSLGAMDAWWLDGIYEALLNRETELIIYKYGNVGSAEVKELFLNSCIRHKDDTESNRNLVSSRIHVVEFLENNTYFLGLENKSNR